MIAKVLNPKIHGILDYLAVGLLLAAPFLFGFRGTSAATLAYGMGFVQLALSVFTAYPLGIVRAIPFPVHGLVELIESFTFMAAPWILGFAELEVARNFFVATGAGLLALWSTTNYQAALPMEQRRRQHDYRDEDIRRAA
jgi:hypothetical protein